MNIEQLRIELSALGNVGLCKEDAKSNFCISVENVTMTPNTVDSFDTIVETYITPFYPVTLVRVMEGNSIKAIYIK
jgi:dUTPase